MKSLGGFYESLNSDDELIFLSIFNQPIPVVEFRGDEKFEYAFGTEMTRAGAYNDPMGRSVLDIKSVQMNQNSFDYYNLKTSNDASFNWDSIDYSAEEIPVLLGSSFKDYYSEGDKIEGWFYLQDMTFNVIGFLEEDSVIYYKGEANFYLDEHIVIPYPSNINYGLSVDNDFYSIVAFAMINGDVVASVDMSSQDVLSRLHMLGVQNEFEDYALLDMPSYLTQLDFMRQLIQNNFSTLISISNG